MASPSWSTLGGLAHPFGDGFGLVGFDAAVSRSHGDEDVEGHGCPDDGATLKPNFPRLLMF